MSKAEERALEVYPRMSRITEPHGVIPADYKSHYIGDANEEKREGFIAGYHQAEKDLELTWEDVDTIYNLLGEEFNYQLECGKRPQKETCQEVLKRFKSQKGG